MPRKSGYGRGRSMLELQDDFSATCVEAARIDALVRPGLEAFEAERIETPRRSAQSASNSRVVQSHKIVTTDAFSSSEYRLDAEIVLIVGTPFPRGGPRRTENRLAHLPSSSASIPVTFACAR
jgi:hypothetical protein